MHTTPQVRRHHHAEADFDGTRAGLDAAYAWLRHAVGDAREAVLLGDVLMILAGNAVRHTPVGHGGQFGVQIASLIGRWKLRVDDDRNNVAGPLDLAGEPGEPLHGLAALTAAGIHWSLPGPGAIVAEIDCVLDGEAVPDLSEPAKRAAESVA
jgi:hypothetical protein